ncbi:YafY family transcriptional regulator [Puniceicoccaceae bacterium K14]|nr:YafY family transcriptional regulator [Puniceicoccaceae bacterium K14]
MSEATRIHSLKRPAIERMLRIHQALKRGGHPNCTKLSRELEVSTKTISRDIDFMRDRMQMPIEYDAVKHGYYYTREVESMPTIDISEGELLALSIAQKSLDLYKGTPFEKPLSNAINKLAASLPLNITSNLEQLSETISFHHGSQSNVDESVLKAITQAAIEKKTISFDYKKPSQDHPTQRNLAPYHIANYIGKWYLIGHDFDRNAVRTFLLSRAEKVITNKAKFSIPDDFSANEYLWNSFGIHTAQGNTEVIIDFSPSIAGYIQENNWHPTQQIERLANGWVRLTFHLERPQDIVQWVISWGEQAKLIKPQNLQKDVTAAAKRILAHYA